MDECRESECYRYEFGNNSCDWRNGWEEKGGIVNIGLGAAIVVSSHPLYVIYVANKV